MREGLRREDQLYANSQILYIPSLSLPLPPPPQVMCICAHENTNLIAIGFKDGTVSTVRGNIMRDRQSRQKIVHEETEPGTYVTGKQLLFVCLLFILFI